MMGRLSFRPCSPAGTSCPIQDSTLFKRYSLQQGPIYVVQFRIPIYIWHVKG